MEGVMLAVQLYSVREDLKKDFVGTLKAVKAMGYEGAEMFGGFPMPPEQFRDGFTEAGLKLVGWHTPFPHLTPDFIEATIAYHKITGCPTVVCPGLPREFTETIDGWKKAAEALNVAAERLAKDGLYTGYHNHAIEFKPLDGQNPWDVIIGATDSRVIMQLDNGNAMSGDGKPMEEIAKFPGRATMVHLKPYSKATGYATMIGKDDVDWPAFLDLCKTTGGTKVFVVEYEDKAMYAPLEGVKACREALKTYGL